MKPMTTNEYRAALEDLELTQVDAGNLFGVGPRSARRWALGEARVPLAVAMMLRLMLNKTLVFDVPIVNDDSHYRVWTFSARSKNVKLE